MPTWLVANQSVPSLHRVHESALTAVAWVFRKVPVVAVDVMTVPAAVVWPRINEVVPVKNLIALVVLVVTE